MFHNLLGYEKNKSDSQKVKIDVEIYILLYNLRLSFLMLHWILVQIYHRVTDQIDSEILLS